MKLTEPCTFISFKIFYFLILTFYRFLFFLIFLVSSFNVFLLISEFFKKLYFVVTSGVHICCLKIIRYQMPNSNISNGALFF